MALVPVVGNPQLSHTSLLQPGVVPPQIGTFTFNTLNTTVFDVGTLIPNTAQQLSVNISIHCGHASQQSIFNVWVWTELEGGRQDIKFIQGMRYPQSAYSSQSETFNFAYSSKHPRLYIKSDFNKGENMWLTIYAVGYAQ
jgi:hypothetical protein